MDTQAQPAQAEAIPALALALDPEAVADRADPDGTIPDTPENRRARQMLETVERLADLLEEEMAVLRRMEVRGVVDLQAPKQMAIDAYERHLREIKLGSAYLAAVAPALRQALTRAAERLNLVLIRNKAALRGAAAANERLLSSIVEAVQQQCSLGYTPDGIRPQRQRSAVSVKLNQIL